jgi:hypothetical protein
MQRPLTISSFHRHLSKRIKIMHAEKKCIKKAISSCNRHLDGKKNVRHARWGVGCARGNLVKIQTETAQKSCQGAITIRRCVFIIMFMAETKIIKRKLKLSWVSLVNRSSC